MEIDFKIGDKVEFVSTPKYYNDEKKKYIKPTGVKVGQSFEVEKINRYGLSLDGLDNYYKRDCLKKL
jgi:hypothetical protein